MQINKTKKKYNQDNQKNTTEKNSPNQNLENQKQKRIKWLTKKNDAKINFFLISPQLMRPI